MQRLATKMGVTKNMAWSLMPRVCTLPTPVLKHRDRSGECQEMEGMQREVCQGRNKVQNSSTLWGLCKRAKITVTCVGCCGFGHAPVHSLFKSRYSINIFLDNNCQNLSKNFHVLDLARSPEDHFFFFFFNRFLHTNSDLLEENVQERGLASCILNGMFVKTALRFWFFFFYDTWVNIWSKENIMFCIRERLWSRKSDTKN